ncbi:MAG: geranylgeranyl reductase family protein [Candidatus Dormibacteraeota bacterium]|nr:geranylgeranyl reductase family protein [Candidatus Dormibacteraeota bacterium]
MASDEFDVIVVGAGPGGSNAAAAALAGGLRVAQVDKAAFPRVKPCAGGLTMKTCRALRLEYAPWVRATWSSVEFNLWGGEGHRFTHRRRPVVGLVLRPEFDNALVRQNLEMRDFRLFSGERFVDASYDRGFTVRTRARTLRAPQLIAADGAYSTVNRQFHLAHPRTNAVAIEVNIPRDDVRSDSDPQLCFDFGAVEAGYGWVFPKDDHLSVGLYTYRWGLKGLRERLLAYIAAKRLAPRHIDALRFDAHQVPVGGYGLSRSLLPLYMVGDAGGFADALTGEGIYHAVESGRIAGETAVAVHRGDARGPALYRRRLWRSVLPDTFLTYQASRVFYRHLRAGTHALEAPGVWRALIEGYADAATFTTSAVRAPEYILRSLLHGSLRYERLASQDVAGVASA